MTFNKHTILILISITFVSLSLGNDLSVSKDSSLLNNPEVNLEIKNDSIYIDKVMIGKISSLNEINDSNPNPIYLPLDKYLKNSTLDSNSIIIFFIQGDNLFGPIYTLMNTFSLNKLFNFRVEVINSKTDKISILKTSFPDENRQITIFKNDTICLVAIIDEKLITLGVKGKFVHKIAFRRSRSAIRTLSKRLSEIKTIHSNAPDINTLIIAASNHIEFDKIASVFNCAIASGFNNIELAKTRRKY